MENWASSVIYLLVRQTGWQLISESTIFFQERISDQYVLTPAAQPSLMDSGTKVEWPGSAWAAIVCA